MAKPVDEIEWVEIYNTTNQIIDLSGWTIKDGNSNNNDDISLSGQIPALSFLVFEHDKGWLNDSGGEIVTLLQEENIEDSYSYTSAIQNKTFGRQPDGNSWTTNLAPTKNSSNGMSSPAPTPSPTPIPTPSPSPSPSTTSSPSPQNIFQISDVPSSINSNQSFNVSVQLKVPSLQNQRIYLKGAFKKESGTNYFGLTKSSENWIRNGESYSKQLSVETNAQGEWNGGIEVMPDVDDSGYTQTENYTFKTTYYTKDGAGPNWSNQTTININHMDNKPPSNPNPSPTPSPSNETPEDLVEDLADGISTTSSEIDEEIVFEEKLKISSSSGVEGIAFQNSSNTKKSNQYSTQLLLIIAGFISLMGAGFWYLRIKRNQLQS